jgi:hypothetical protein
MRGLTVVEHAWVLIENGIDESNRAFPDGYTLLVDAIDLTDRQLMK